MGDDRRWPWMFRVNGRALPGLSAWDSLRVTRWASDVARRTMTHPWFNARMGQVSFCLRPECGAAAWVETVVRGDGTICRTDADATVRAVMRTINTPMKVKERSVAWAERDAESGREESSRRMFDEIRPEVMAEAERRISGRVSASVP